MQLPQKAPLARLRRTISINHNEHNYDKSYNNLNMEKLTMSTIVKKSQS